MTSTRNPERLEVLVAPGADGELTLVEDDGTGTAPGDIPTARTTLTWRQGGGELEIGAAEDPHGVLPGARTWTVTFLGLDPDTPLRVDGGSGEPVAGGGRCGAASVTVRDVPTDRPLWVRAGSGDPVPRTLGRADAMFALLTAAQFGHEAKAAAWETLTSELAPEAMLAELHAKAVPRELIGALSELLTARA